MKNQEEIDRANKTFWDELCGSRAASQLGIKDRSPESLEKFDRWYFDFYPYLTNRYLNQNYENKKVLEIGLGFGTVGQYVAQKGAIYQGLDIAHGPVEMMNYRLGNYRLNGNAIQGSMLSCPFENESFDEVISIGCFHHTGNVKLCIDHTYRVLKPGGRALIMVYNQFALRQWTRWPTKTTKAFISQINNNQFKNQGNKDQCKEYDCNTLGEACPEVSFWSVTQLRKLCSKFRESNYYRENFGQFSFAGKTIIKRNSKLSNLCRIFGTDIYFTLVK